MIAELGIIGAILQYSWLFAAVSHLMAETGAAGTSTGKHPKDDKDPNRNPKKKKKRKHEPLIGKPVVFNNSQDGGSYVTNVI